MNGEADTYPKLTVFVRVIDRVDAISELEAGELELAFARLDAEAGNATATLPMTKTASQRPCQQTSHLPLYPGSTKESCWRPLLRGAATDTIRWLSML